MLYGTTTLAHSDHIAFIASYRTKTGPLRSPGSSYPVRGLWEFWNGNFVVTVEELVEYLVADCLIGIHKVSYLRYAWEYKTTCI